MAAFINNGITTAGLIVLAKGVAGQKINYTKIVLGDGYLEEGQTPRTLTGVVSPKATVDNPSLVNSNLDLFLKLLRTVKRRSSWLDAILICLTGEMFLYSGMAVRDHTQEVHVMGSDEIHIYHAAVVHDNNRETVSIGTDAAVISD